MAIIKQAKNIKVKVRDNDVIMAKKYTQVAEEITIESLDKNVTLACNKKIVSTGGVTSETK